MSKADALHEIEIARAGGDAAVQQIKRLQGRISELEGRLVGYARAIKTREEELEALGSMISGFREDMARLEQETKQARDSAANILDESGGT